MIDHSRLQAIVERYGDNPMQVIRNGLLGVARKRNLKRLKPEDKRAKVDALVREWETAMTSNHEALVDWITSRV